MILIFLELVDFIDLFVLVCSWIDPATAHETFQWAS